MTRPLASIILYCGFRQIPHRGTGIRKAVPTHLHRSPRMTAGCFRWSHCGRGTAILTQMRS